MDKERIKAAVDFLKDGQSFKLGELTLGRTDKGDILVTGWTNFTNIENITRDTSLSELKEIKGLFDKLTLMSSDLKEFTKDKKVEYHLAYDDAGKVGVDICHETDGQLTWTMDLKE